MGISSLAWAHQPWKLWKRSGRLPKLSTAPATKERAPRERKQRWIRNEAWGLKFTKLNTEGKREYKRLKMREYRERDKKARQ